MQKYRSHKVVEAAPIWKMTAVTDFSDGVVTDCWDVIVLLGEGQRDETVRVPHDTFKRGTPKPGDYLVKYTDQPDAKPYWSWSPKEVFEAGYTALANDAKTE